VAPDVEPTHGSSVRDKCAILAPNVGTTSNISTLDKFATHIGEKNEVLLLSSILYMNYIVLYQHKNPCTHKREISNIVANGSTALNCHSAYGTCYSPFQLV